jgi:hypothetical protein
MISDALLRPVLKILVGPGGRCGLALVLGAGAWGHAVAGSQQTPPLAAIVPDDTDAPASLRVLLDPSNCPPAALGAFALRAYGESLLGPTNRGARTSSAWALTALLNANLLVNGRGPDTFPDQPLKVMERSSGPDWQYISVDLTPAYGKRLTRFHRRLLHVEPDLFVICDDVTAPEPAAFEFLLHSTGTIRVDPRSHEVCADLPRAGFTAHCLTPGRNGVAVGPALLSANATDMAPDGPSHLHFASTNLLAELHLLTPILVHPAGQRKASGFFLIEGHGAIGARIYRDGLPTLVAFRTDPAATDATVSSMPVRGPVAVSVFRGKTK